MRVSKLFSKIPPDLVDIGSDQRFLPLEHHDEAISQGIHLEDVGLAEVSSVQDETYVFISVSRLPCSP